jgi:hypothetical protein
MWEAEPNMRKMALWFLGLAFLAIPHWAAANNIVRLGENVTIPAGMEVDELIVFNGTATVGGRILGNVTVLNGKAVLQATARIQGDVVCLGGTIESQPGAEVSGSRVEIGGKVNWKSLPFYAIFRIMWWGFLYKVATAVILLLLSVFFVIMWPEQIRFAAAEASHDLVKSTLVGVFALALLVPLGIGFAITIFGMPIAFAVFVFLAVASWFGVACMSYLVGMKISSRFSPVLAVVVGLLILKFVHFVPFIGAMLYFIAILPGVGAILLTRFGTNQPWLGSAAPKGKSPRGK